MSYINYLYQDLIDVISTYLDYTSLSILKSEYKFQINYEVLLRNRYPAFYKILKFIKENDVNYEGYPYDQAYNLMNNVEEFMIIRLDKTYEEARKRNIPLNNKLKLIKNDVVVILEDNVDELITTIYNNKLDFDDLLDIIASYNLINSKNQEEKELIKYKIFMPNFKFGNEYFRAAIEFYIEEHPDIDDIIELPHSTVALYILFLYVLKYEGSLTDIKDKILNYKLKKEFTGGGDKLTQAILYRHIINYINKNS